MDLYKLHSNPHQLKYYDRYPGRGFASLVALYNLPNDETHYANETVIAKIREEYNLRYDNNIEAGDSPISVIENEILRMQESGADMVDLMILYANEILQGRWPAAEKYIARDHYAWDIYKANNGLD